MGFFKEFKDFAVQGNVLDLAVGVIIGAAFGKIAASLVDDILMPPIGYLLGGANMRDLAFEIAPATTDAAGKEVAAVAIKYGNFLQNTIEFLIVAFVIFLVVRAANKMRKDKA